MIQVYNEERCPEWIKKKCEKVTEAKSIVTFNVVIYESVTCFVGKEEKIFYIIRDKEIDEDKAIRIVNELIS